MYNSESYKNNSGQFGSLAMVKYQIVPLITDTLKPIYAEAKKAAEFDDVSVLITGETGTGKELIARHIQKQSPRKNRRYVELNIGKNSGDLINSDLFGHLKGSYTGATNDRKGFLAKADKGTIFLDEIGEAPMDVQKNLLRVIQEGTFYPVGSDEEERTNVRIISATNASLKNKILNGSFREDLYYRISDFEIELPPLRKYPKNELKEIFEHFLTEKAKKINKRAPWIKTDALDKILNYQFRANFRDLDRIVKRIFISQKVEVNETDLSGILDENEISVPKTMDEIKYSGALEALKKNLKLVLIH
jgi:DNA-binding NtrC family response regulator